MNRNKLTFAAGTLLVIAASLSIAMALSFASEVFSAAALLADPELTLVEYDLTMTYFLVGINAIACLFAVLESIAYMILGVKLLKKTKAGVPLQKMKSLVVVSLVFSAIGIAFSFSIVSALMIASVIVLSCALVNGSKKHTASEEKPEEVDSVEKFVTLAKMVKTLKDEGVITDKEFQKIIVRVISPDNLKDDTKEVTDEK